jgi:AcrR family transcriptional regulator
VGKGEATRQAILERAGALASRHGLGGLTIGGLAKELELSKSGLFAHFQSKEALQIQTIRFVAEQFVDVVVRPGLKAARGEPRVRELLTRWLLWEARRAADGGCLFVAASTEFDDQDGPVRDELVRQQRDWLELIASVARGAVGEGHFRADLDSEQFAHELHGAILAYHHAERLLRDPRARRRVADSFERLVADARRGAQNPVPHLVWS